LIKVQSKGVEQFVMGHTVVVWMYWQIFFGKSTQDIFGEFDGKIMIKNILMEM
jgi:hypothetical protein